MADKTWKARERQVASYFNTHRTPLSGGSSRHTRSDSLHDELFVECKLRKKHSVISLWDETNEMAKKESKTPVIALCDTNNECKNIDLVLACNNKGKKSLGLIFYILSIMKKRYIKNTPEMFILPIILGLFYILFYKPSEVYWITGWSDKELILSIYLLYILILMFY